jgi:hypothetical protein
MLTSNDTSSLALHAYADCSQAVSILFFWSQQELCKEEGDPMDHELKG